MRFLVDAQLPPLLARWLRAQGHEAEHVASFLSATASDREIVAAALLSGFVIVTKDVDFVDLILAPPPQLILVTMGNVANRMLLNRFEAQLEGLIEQLEAGRAVAFLD